MLALGRSPLAHRTLVPGLCAPHYSLDTSISRRMPPVIRIFFTLNFLIYYISWKVLEAYLYPVCNFSSRAPLALVSPFWDNDPVFFFHL